MKSLDVHGTLGALVLGIDHLTIAVRDLESSIRWYEGGLGFRVSERRETRGDRTSMRSAVLECGGAVLVLVEGGEPESQVNRFIEAKGEGVSHIAFKVSDLDEAMRRIHAVVGEVTLPTVEDVGIRQVFLQPDSQSGVRIELIERSGGSFSDQSVRKLFLVLETNELY